MEIGSLSEEIETAYALKEEEGSVCWNGRNVRQLEELGFLSASSPLFCARHQVFNSLHHRQGFIKPLMNRAPDESKASIEAGYDERRGVFVEGKWVWTWNDKDDQDLDSNTGEAPRDLDSADSRDRDVEKN